MKAITVIRSRLPLALAGDARNLATSSKESRMQVWCAILRLNKGAGSANM